MSYQIIQLSFSKNLQFDFRIYVPMPNLKPTRLLEVGQIGCTNLDEIWYSIKIGSLIFWERTTQEKRLVPKEPR